MQLELLNRFSWPADFRLGRIPSYVLSRDIRDATIVTFADGMKLLAGREYIDDYAPYTLCVFDSEKEILKIEDYSEVECKKGIGRSLRITSENQIIGNIKTTGTRFFRGGLLGTLMLCYRDRIEYVRKVYHGKIKSLGLNVFPYYFQCRMKAEKSFNSGIDDLLLLAVCTELWFAAYAWR